MTLQPNSLWVRRSGERTELVAAVSNIGGMDSDAVIVQFKVNGKVVGTKRVEKVPAGYSRLTNRALVALNWSPEKPGMYIFEAEIMDALGSTVLDPTVEERRFVSPTQ